VDATQKASEWLSQQMLDLKAKLKNRKTNSRNMRLTMTSYSWKPAREI